MNNITAQPDTFSNLETFVDTRLTSFLAPNHPVCKDIMAIRNYRGDCTQSDADRMRLALGEKAYDHYNWDTAICSGRILLLIPRFKHPQGVLPGIGFHFPAEWFWCFSQIEQGEDIAPASPELIATVPEDLRAQIHTLPGVEWLAIRQVNSFTHNGRGKPKANHNPPPAGIIFFRFTGGLGLSLATNKS